MSSPTLHGGGGFPPSNTTALHWGRMTHMSNKGVGPQRFLDQNHLDSLNKLSILETHLRPIKSEPPGVEPGLVCFKKAL